jgi:hypothetical protein
MEERKSHYMPPSLLPSQLATLEPLEDDEPGVVVTTEGSTEEVLDRAMRALGLREEKGVDGFPRQGRPGNPSSRGEGGETGQAGSR